MSQPSGVINLMTDFGEKDVFVGVMKGVISGINPSARVIDLTHAVPAFDAVEAAWLLRDAYGFFPSGTVHVVVVDPGVGTSRRIVAARADGHVFLAPDTGILSPVAAAHAPEAMVRVENSAYRLPHVSPTFHGRDIFAPAAAHLSLGVPLEELGPAIDSMAPLSLPAPEPTPSGGVRGQVLRFDRFGNLMTNIPVASLGDTAGLTVQFGDWLLHGIQSTFGEVEAGKPTAIAGSSGYVEICVNQGNARDLLGARRGDPVEIAPGDRTS